jgi:plastocyanin
MLSAAKLLRPDGSQLASLTLSGATGFLDVQTLPTTGTYTVLVDPYGASVGSATLRLYTVPADAGGPIVAGGSAVSATTTAPGQNVRFTFSGSPGQRVSVSVSGSSLSTTALKILKPDGSQLAGTTIAGNGFLDTATLTVAGTHTVLLDPSGSTVGSATVQLHAITDVSGSITAGGAAVPVALTTPGQNGSITFSGTTGQAITLVVDQVTISLTRVSIQKPDGTNLVAPTTVGTTGKTITATLTATGTHTIVLDPTSAYTGSLRLRLTSP